MRDDVGASFLCFSPSDGRAIHLFPAGCSFTARCIDATENDAITSGCVTFSGFTSACVFTPAVSNICVSPKWKFVQLGTSRDHCKLLRGHVADRCVSARYSHGLGAYYSRIVVRTLLSLSSWICRNEPVHSDIKYRFSYHVSSVEGRCQMNSQVPLGQSSLSARHILKDAVFELIGGTLLVGRRAIARFLDLWIGRFIFAFHSSGHFFKAGLGKLHFFLFFSAANRYYRTSRDCVRYPQPFPWERDPTAAPRERVAT